MIEKKSYTGLYIVVLPLFLILGYYISALYKIPNLSLKTLENSMTYIIMHPLQNWWNDKSFPCMGVALLGWLMFVSWFSYNNRNFQFDNEHGHVEWANLNKTGKKLRDKDPKKNRIYSENIQVSENVLSNNNALVIATSGGYKTTGIVETNLLKARGSFIILDVKGDMLYKYGNYLKHKGYTIRVINLYHPRESDRFNPFEIVKEEKDLVRLVATLHDSVQKPESHSSDPFWDDGVDLYLQAMVYYEWLEAQEEHRNATFNAILKLSNEETIIVDEETQLTRLQEKMDLLAARKNEYYPPVRDYRKLKKGATETVRTLILIVNTLLKLCETADIKRIFSGNDINIREFGMGVNDDPNKPVSIFLVIPPNDSSYNFIASMFYTQLFDELMRISNEELHGKLPIPVTAYMDEFYAGARPKDPDVLLGIIRSANISMIPVLQSISQIKTLFKDNKWETIMDNCPVVCFFGSGPASETTNRWVSDLLGETTIDVRTDGQSHGRMPGSNINFQKAARKLMTPSEVREMDLKDCILFIQGCSPIYDHKAISFLSQLVKKEYKQAMKLGGYVHQVCTIYNEETMEYQTIEDPDKIHILTTEEMKFYQGAAKKNPNIRIFDIDEKDVLYLNWKKDPPLSAEEIKEMFDDLYINEENEKLTEAEDLPEDVKMLPEFDHSQWILNGDVIDCLRRYAKYMTEKEIDEVLQGLEAGLNEWQIKQYFCLSADKMEQYRRAYMFTNQGV